MPLPATDAFTGSNGDPLSADWTTNQGSFDIQTNAASPDTAAVWNFAHWDTDTFAADQQAKVTLTQVDGTGNAGGVAVRCNTGGSANGYGFTSDSAGSDLWKVTAGSQVGLDTGPAVAAGSEMLLTVAGTTFCFLEAYDDGVMIMSEYLDGAHTTGAAGIAGFNNSVSMRVDDFEGDDIAFGYVRQIKTATDAGATSVTATFDDAPLEDNLIVVGHFTGDGVSTAPSGYSTAINQANEIDADSFAIYYKVAGVAEASAIAPGSGSSDEHTVTIMEVTGGWLASPYVNVGYNAVIGESRNHFDCGKTAKTRYDNTFAFALDAIRNSTMVHSNWTNNFIERTDDIGATTKNHATASLRLTTDQQVSTSGTMSTSRVANGITAVFAASGQTQNDADFGDVVQLMVDTAVDNAAPTLTFDNTPTPGNLLLAIHDDSEGGSDAPSGFTEAVSLLDVPNDNDAAIYWKIAGGSEPTTVTFDSSSAGSDNVIMIMEIEGTWESSPVDQTDTNALVDSDTYTAGPTGTTSQDDEFVVAFLDVRDSGDAGVTSNFDNGFISQTGDLHLFNAGPFSSIVIGTKVLTTTGTPTTSATFESSQDGQTLMATFMQGALADRRVELFRPVRRPAFPLASM